MQRERRGQLEHRACVSLADSGHDGPTRSPSILTLSLSFRAPPPTQKKKAPAAPKKPPTSSTKPLPANTLPAVPAPLPLDAQLALKLRDAKRRGGGEGGEDAADSGSDEDAFEARLAALRTEAAAASAARKAAASENVLLGGSERPDYSNPPPLSATLAKAAGADSSSSGPGGAGLAAGALAIVLAAVFAFTSADFSGSGRRNSGTKAPPNFMEGADSLLGPEARSDLESKAAALEARLADAPTDVDALRTVASLDARLGKDPAVIAGFLTRLVEASPSDAAGWRALGTAKLAGGDITGAVAALERARAEAPPAGAAAFDPAGDAEAVVPLAAARVLLGSPKAAVEELRAALATAGPSDGEPALRIGLALGKTLAEWPNHGPEAVEAYGKLGEGAPKDFRPPLARGVLYRSLGRPAEARRSLLQARFLAPPEERAVVEAIIAAGGEGPPPLMVGVGGGEKTGK